MNTILSKLMGTSFDRTKYSTTKLFSLLALLLMLGVNGVMGQTNPTAQSLPYTQNFGTTTFTAMPTGMAAWNTFGSNLTTQSNAETSSPGGNAALAVATSSTTTGGINGYMTSSNARVYIQQSSNATNGTNQIVVAINTGSGVTSINLSYQLEMINGGAATQDFGIELQYRAGTSGSWTNVSGSAITFGAVTSYTTATQNYTISGLTASTAYQIRWIVWRPSGSGASKGVGIDNISISAANTPTIVGTATATAFTTTSGTASTAQGFSISGSNLTANIVATAPTGFQVSRDSTNYQDTVQYAQSSGTASGRIHIRLKATAAVGGAYKSQSITLTSTSATTVNITTAASGNTVTAKALTILGLTGQNKNYDGTTTASVTGTAAYNGLVNSESFSVSTSGTISWAFPSSAVGSYT